DAEQIDQMVSGIIRQLESAGDGEIDSNAVGELVMAALKDIDPVGYVRYASVYKDFRDPGDFAEFIKGADFDEDDDAGGA
ncbi:MAG: ATP cone domain-containing protein, partial [Pseudomonadota bacterium]